MEASSPTPPAPSAPFSTVIRTASHAQHTEAENSSFMSDLLGGRLGVRAYRRYTEQLWFVYRALEDASGPLADDPVAGPFLRPELARTAALERDLAHLGGPSWHTGLTPLPATAAYADRVAACAHDWPAGFVAHHYTRYLGDLSGGQIIRGTARKPGASPARATESASTSSRASPTPPPSSASTAHCWTRYPWTTWKSSGWWRSASAPSE